LWKCYLLNLILNQRAYQSISSISSIMSSNLRYVVVLPCMGSPYIEGNAVKKDSDQHLDLLQKGVNGYIEPTTKNWVIHPMFLEENRRWKIAEVLRKFKGVRAYDNECGRFKCGVNSATVITDAHYVRANGGCPHLLGDVVLDVPVSVFEAIKVNPDCLKMTHPADEAIEDEIDQDCDEEDLDEDDRKKMAEWKEKGYEFVRGAGQLYMAKA
jgi:hypothetical protein